MLITEVGPHGSNAIRVARVVAVDGQEITTRALKCMAMDKREWCFEAPRKTLRTSVRGVPDESDPRVRWIRALPAVPSA